MVSLTIDGEKTSVEPGTTILAAAQGIGIKIPTLCWLQKVSPTGACRICEVEVEGVDRPMTACNTPVKEGIVVTTQSEKLSAIRKKIMELLLVNHPLDCPVCDAGGECDLQDSCYSLDVARQHYSATLERRPIRYDWKLLESDPNRCILCEKCVKVDHEIVGCDAIAVVNKGEATIIDTVDGKPLNCEFCGNCIAACPTGTLISKPFKFKGRPWTFDVTRSVCPFCSTGCQIEYHSKNGRVERVTSDDSTFNEGNLCVNGRFGYAYLNSPDRLLTPRVEQKPASWESALSYAVEKLKGFPPAAVAGIASPRLTNEENFLLAKLVKEVIGSPNLDSEAGFGFRAALSILKKQLGIDGASATIDRIDRADAILVIGSDLNSESTGIEYRVIKAARKNDAKLVVANLRTVKLNKFANSFLQYKPGCETALLASLAKALLEAGCNSEAPGAADFAASLANQTFAELAAAAGVSEATIREAAALLAGSNAPAVIFGADIIRSATSAVAVPAVANIALLLGALGKEAGGIFPVDEKNNTLGMIEMGAVPGDGGLDCNGIIAGIENGGIKALYIAGANPLATWPDNIRIKKAFAKLELLIVQDILESELTKMAHVVLPGSAAAEKTGTFTTPDGRVQTLQQAAQPPSDAREDIAIISDIIARYSGTAQQYDAASVGEEIAAINPLYGSLPTRGGTASASFAALSLPPAVSADFTLLTGSSLYHNGSTTLASENNVAVAPEPCIEFDPADAARLGLAEGSTVVVTSATASITARAQISDRLQPGLVFATYHSPALNATSLLTGASNSVSVSISKS
jgi:formate dehydrogenase alpha subunit